MIRIFIAGHGRCLASDKKVLPSRVTLSWFGELGKSVTKGFTKAVLRGNLDSIGDAGSGGAYSEHYLCDTLQIEATARLQAFQQGAWDANTYIVQFKYKQGCMKLSTFIAYCKARWPDEDLDIRWAVCRTSLTGGAVFTHGYDDGAGIQTLVPSKGAAAPDPKEMLVDVVNDSNVWFTRWRADLVKESISPMPASSF